MIPIRYVLDCAACGEKDSLVCYDTSRRPIDFDILLGNYLKGRSLSFFKCSKCGEVFRSIRWQIAPAIPMPMRQEEIEELEKKIKEMFSF